jgi:hypothetical protein
LNNSKDKRKIALLQWATLAVALGPVGKNDLAHLGLSALSVEIGELPHSSLAHGSPAESGRPAASGRGRRCQGASPEVRVPIWGIGGGGAHRGGLAAVKQVISGEPTMAGRRRGGERRVRVRVAAVSSGEGRCGDGGARRWPKVALDGRAASTTEGGGRIGASTVGCGGRWLSSRLGMAQRRMRAVRGGRRLEQRSAATRVQRSAPRAGRSGWRSAAVAGRGETTSPIDRQRDEVAHGAATACVACGADLEVGRQRRHKMVAVAAQLSRTRDASVRAPFKHRLRLTSGPRQFFYLKDFQTLTF